MSHLLETIKVKDGKIYNIDYHSERFNRSRKELYSIGLAVDLRDKIIVPAFAHKGLFKCRIEYNEHIRKIEFIPYEIKSIGSLRLVEAMDYEYNYKYLDRKGIDSLLAKKYDCDDILIVKDGYLCDSSYANIVLRADNDIWYTPSTVLLAGTKRKSLLDSGLIKDIEITPASLRKFKELRLINSMLDIDDTESIPVNKICF